MEEKKNVVHLINDLLIGGGAEKMLYNITKYADLSAYDVKVISLLPIDGYKEKIENSGVDVYILDIKKHPFHTIKECIKIFKKTDTLFCWMYASNLVGYLCGRIARVKKINLGIRHSDVGKDMMKLPARITNKLGAFCSHSKYVTNVIYNGEKAKNVHEEIGYSKKKSKVIKNGCEIDYYKYCPEARKMLLEQKKALRDDATWIISATRYNKIKDVPNFLNTMGNIKKKYKNIQIFMCGNGFKEENEELIQLIQNNDLKLEEDIFLMGLVQNLPEMFSACDLYVLHSAAEAFPNTLLEAMACEIECVCTNAGDVTKIFPDKTHIVPVQDTEKLTKVVRDVLEKGKPMKRPEYRKIVEENYSISNVVKEYEFYY